MGRLFLEHFVEEHHPLLCWLSASGAIVILATILDRVISEEAMIVFLLAMPLLAIAWLAAAAAELFQAVSGRHESPGAVMAAMLGTMLLSLLGPLLIYGLISVTDRVVTWAGIVWRLAS
jgi:hypothetical protein